MIFNLEMLRRSFIRLCNLQIDSKIICANSKIDKYSTSSSNNEKPRYQIPSRPIDWKNFKLTNVVESKEEFEFVKKLIPSPIVPDPPKHESYPTPSGWVPPDYDKSSRLPYYVLRTRFHNFPIYLLEHEGGSRKLVKIKFVEGNIWEFDKDLRKFLEECLVQYENKNQKIYTQVNEILRQVVVKGHYHDYINKFFIKCGF